MKSYLSETPQAVAEEMVALAQIKEGQNILEPGASDGALLRALLRVPLNDCLVYYCEMNTAKAETLQRDFSHPFQLLARDFFTVDDAQWSEKFDRIVMSPPRNEDKHLLKAYGLLKPGGIIVALIYGGDWLTSTALTMPKTVVQLPPERFESPAKDLFLVTINKPTNDHV